MEQSTSSTFNHLSKIFCVFGIIFMSLSCAVSKEKIKGNDEISNFLINVKIKIADVDNLGRIYVVDDKNRLINYKPDLKEQYRYANTKSGIISSIDVNNPLKIIAFYDDFNFVKIFDNTLTIINELNLADKFVDISACGVSNDGGLWVYDPTQFKLLKINENGQIKFETSNVNDFGMTDVKITDIREKSNYVVLCDRKKGFYIFDNFGQYMFHFAASDILSFQFDGRIVFYYTPTGLKSYSIKFKERQMIGFPLEMKKDGLKYILHQGGDFYEINEHGINVVKKTF